MKKYCLDLVVRSTTMVTKEHVLLRLTHAAPLPAMVPGQFVNVRVDHSPTTFLRRPISIHLVDYAANELWLLIHIVGAGTRALAQTTVGETINCLLPLGNGFTVPRPEERVLLVGGGVGVAPLLFLAHSAQQVQAQTTFLIGAKRQEDLLQQDRLAMYGTLCVTTEDGSQGVPGFVTHHPVLHNETFDRIYVCGPRPMMTAVARLAKERNVPCEVSLENLMACGLGACLCCTEHTVHGNLRVCSDGPVFDAATLYL